MFTTTIFLIMGMTFCYVRGAALGKRRAEQWFAEELDAAQHKAYGEGYEDGKHAEHFNQH